MSDLETLASIIQGEASSYEGQLGVATVIQNRAASNLNGFGTTPVAQATAPSQFTPNPQTPTPQAISIAQQLLDGDLPESDAGDALYFQSKTSENSDSNFFKAALGIGGNYFATSQSGGIPTALAPDSSKQGDTGAEYEASGAANMSVSTLNEPPPGASAPPTGNVASAITNAANSQDSTNISLAGTNSLISTNLLVRGGLILLGLVLLIGVFLLLTKGGSDDGKPEIIPIPA